MIFTFLPYPASPSPGGLGKMDEGAWQVVQKTDSKKKQAKKANANNTDTQKVNNTKVGDAFAASDLHLTPNIWELIDQKSIFDFPEGAVQCGRGLTSKHSAPLREVIKSRVGANLSLFAGDVRFNKACNEDDAELFLHVYDDTERPHAYAHGWVSHVTVHRMDPRFVYPAHITENSSCKRFERNFVRLVFSFNPAQVYVHKDDKEAYVRSYRYQLAFHIFREYFHRLLNDIRFSKSIEGLTAVEP